MLTKGEIARFKQFLLLSPCLLNVVCCRCVRKRLHEGKGSDSISTYAMSHENRTRSRQANGNTHVVLASFPAPCRSRLWSQHNDLRCGFGVSLPVVLLNCPENTLIRNTVVSGNKHIKPFPQIAKLQQTTLKISTQKYGKSLYL